MLLNATDTINHSLFEGSTILLSTYSYERGAIGFILNKTQENMRIGGPIR